MKASTFLRYCARQIDAGERVDNPYETCGWNDYIVMTLPVDYEFSAALVDTRVLRFLLAAEIAASEGN